MAAVVFLFLGNWRATLIPMVAVPVSLIGTFAVLLAAGYSANTVSLLAMVLAIGIVVDDAIVVVENVERVFAAEPELSPAEATKKAMAQITAPVIAITLVLLSVFVPVAFIPGMSGELFRQFAVTIIAAMLISALNSLTLVAGAVRRVPATRAAIRAGLMAMGARAHRQGARRLCGGCGRKIRVVDLSSGLVAASGAGIWSLSATTPTGFLPEEDQGAFFVVVQLPDGCVGGAHRASGSAGEKILKAHAADRGRDSRRRLFACSMAATSRTPPSWLPLSSRSQDRQGAADWRRR